MTITISNLRYADTGKTLIDMDVAGVIAGQTIPFTYDPADTAPVSVAVKNLLASGNNSIAPYVAPAAQQVASVSPRQIRLALTQIGLRQQVEDYVNAASISVQDSWHYSTSFLITDPMIAACMAALGKTQADLNNLFTLASTL